MTAARDPWGTAPRRPPLSPLGTVAASAGARAALPAGLLELMASSDLDETNAFLAWQLAAMPRQLGDDQRARLATLLGRLLIALSTGSTRLALADEDRAWLAAMNEMVAAARPDGTAAHRPLVLAGDYLYTERSHAAEQRVAARLAARLTGEAFAAAELAPAVDGAALGSAPPPTDEQKATVARVLRRPLGVIAGGPGTGKTTTALLLVRTLARLGLPPAAIALAAPTGKAKSRLDDDFRARLQRLHAPADVDRSLLAECPPAQTLHHLLRATAGARGLARAGRDPLPYRALIVDEASMIDLALMDRLLAVLPARCLLVLLGDADQLPSVSAGAVFRDLRDVAAHLTRGFRADPARPGGAELVALGEAVRAGAAERIPSLCPARQTAADVQRIGPELVGGGQRAALLRDHHARLFDAPAVAALRRQTLTLADDGFDAHAATLLDGALAELGRARVLAVTRHGRAGVERGNAFLHDLGGSSVGFVPGEPVLMMRNDYERELWNGDGGVVVRARRPGRSAEIIFAFRSRGGWVAVEANGAAGALPLGYVLTVHKAQGSEYEDVIFLLPDYPCPLLTRELVYTAVSRARSSVVVCGDAAWLAAGVLAQSPRSSGIAERMTRIHAGP